MAACSHIEAGAAAAQAERKKVNKYACFGADYEVTPLAFESHGSLGPSTTLFLEELSRRISTTTGDPRAGVYFRQRLCLALQRGNANLILGTMPQAPTVTAPATSLTPGFPTPGRVQ